jgi:hypothetical protein
MVIYFYGADIVRQTSSCFLPCPWLGTMPMASAWSCQNVDECCVILPTFY